MEAEYYRDEPVEEPPITEDVRAKESKKTVSEQPKVSRDTAVKKPELERREERHEIPKERAKGARIISTPPASPGRGGQLHKRLQSAIQHMGHDHGYRSTIEKEILGGTGSVDVALERNGLSVACEISVTTDTEQEIGNIQKCLAAGFDHVALISANKHTLNNVKKHAKESLPEQDISRLQFLTSEDFNAFLDKLDASAAGKEQTVRGYKVKTTYAALSETEKKARKKIIAETILQALRNKDRDKDKDDDERENDD